MKYKRSKGIDNNWSVITLIVGSRKPEQVSQFAAAGEVELSEAQLARLKRASGEFFHR